MFRSSHLTIGLVVRMLHIAWTHLSTYPLSAAVAVVLMKHAMTIPDNCC
jgi:hypothetical protein